MNRTCCVCGAKVGTKHKRKKLFVWKKKPRNLILTGKEKAIEKLLEGRAIN